MKNEIAMEIRSHEHIAMPDTNHMGKNLLAAFLIFVLSLSLFIIALFPEISKLLRVATLSRELAAWTIALGSLSLAGILFIFPLYLIIQTYIYFRNAQELDRSGILTMGQVIDKWVDESNNWTLHYICYSYCHGQNAMQAVSGELFHQIECNQNISVMHLPHAPHISRLVLNSP